MKRIAFTMKLKPGCEEEYVERHKQIWPELARTIGHAGISDYSIFLDRSSGTLFAVQKISGETGSQGLAKDPIVQKWWEYMADLMHTHPDHSPVTNELTEIFHLD